MNFSPEEREAYEEHLKWLRIEANTLKKAEARGEARGRAEGKAEGKAEEKKEIVLAMLAEGCDLNFIIKVTKLTAEQITKIKEESSKNRTIVN